MVKINPAVLAAHGVTQLQYDILDEVCGAQPLPVGKMQLTLQARLQARGYDHPIPDFSAALNGLWEAKYLSGGEKTDPTQAGRDLLARIKAGG